MAGCRAKCRWNMRGGNLKLVDVTQAEQEIQRAKQELEQQQRQAEQVMTQVQSEQVRRSMPLSQRQQILSQINQQQMNITSQQQQVQEAEKQVTEYKQAQAIQAAYAKENEEWRIAQKWVGRGNLIGLEGEPKSIQRKVNEILGGGQMFQVQL